MSTSQSAATAHDADEAELFARLNRIEPWRRFYALAGDDPERAYVTTLWRTREAFRWFIRINIDRLKDAGAIVELNDRGDQFVDPVAMRRVALAEAARMFNGFAAAPRRKAPKAGVA
jgi:hypothetical protein